MSVRAMAVVWTWPLPSTEKLLALALADFADDAGGSIYPAVETMAAKTGQSDRNVRRLLRKLEARGLLVVELPGGGRSSRTGRGWTTRYRLVLSVAGDAINPDNLTE